MNCKPTTWSCLIVFCDSKSTLVTCGTFVYHSKLPLPTQESCRVKAATVDFVLISRHNAGHVTITIMHNSVISECQFY
jgi:hypothetical protein